MRDQEEFTPTSPNVFTPRFLERLAELPRSGSRTSFEANHAGPWTVVKVPQGFSVEKAGSEIVKAVVTHHETAHLLAAILPGVGRPVRYRVTSAEEGRPGVGVEALEGKSHERVGWLHDYSDETLEALHVAECLLRSPASLALFLQAASYESLEPAGGIAAGRILI